MKSDLEYKGIKLVLKQSVKHRAFYGKLITSNSEDEVTFECKSFSRIKKCFESLVDEYIKMDSSPIILHCVDSGVR